MLYKLASLLLCTPNPKQKLASWDLKIDKFVSAVNQSEEIGEKRILHIIDKVSGYGMLNADPTQGKRFRSYEPK